MDEEATRCPRCERRIRLTRKGLIGKHDRGAFHRTACKASGKDYAAEVKLYEEKGRQDA